jgi:hypothetical protein
MVRLLAWNDFLPSLARVWGGGGGRRNLYCDFTADLIGVAQLKVSYNSSCWYILDHVLIGVMPSLCVHHNRLSQTIP